MFGVFRVTRRNIFARPLYIAGARRQHLCRAVVVVGVAVTMSSMHVVYLYGVERGFAYSWRVL